MTGVGREYLVAKEWAGFGAKVWVGYGARVWEDLE